MKQAFLRLFLFVMLLLSAGCTKTTVQPIIQVEKPVTVRVLKEETNNTTLDYIGVVGTDPTHNLSFKSGGKIKAIHVHKGQKITVGSPLASLDTQELQLAFDAAEAQLASVQAQYEKAVNGADAEDIRRVQLSVQMAKDAYTFSSDNLIKTQSLFKSGAASQNSLDQIKLETELRKSELEQANQVLTQMTAGTRIEDLDTLAAQVDQAKASRNIHSKALSDAELISDIEGVVLDILHENGEMIAAGYPVVIIGNNTRTAIVGVTNDDYPNISIGMSAQVGKEVIKATVTNISEIPDNMTRTYEVELALPKNAYTTGTIVDVSFLTGTTTGIWIPLAAIMAEGDHFVFLERDRKAVKTRVVIEELKGTDARVSGLSTGDHLVVEGIHRLIEGDLIDVQYQEDEE